MSNKGMVGVLAVVSALGLVGCADPGKVWEFRSPTDLDGWTVSEKDHWDQPYFSSLETVSAGTGVLRVTGATGSWYGSTVGGLISRDLEGDFVATTRLYVYGADGPLPKGTFELAGLMLRKPLVNEGHDAANWEYLVTGGSGGERMVDFKTTRESVSAYQTKSPKGPWIELRLARWGSKIVKLWREDGASWQWAETQDRPDLVGKMQFGLCFLTNWDGESDLHADIDWVRIDPLPSLPTSVPATEQEWTKFLGPGEVTEFRHESDLAAFQALEVTNWDEQAFGSCAIVSSDAGLLRVVADHGTWFKDSTGGFLSRSHSGDFSVSTRIRVYGAEGELPNGSFELAGLMVRQPGVPSKDKRENWEYVVTGGDFGKRIVDFKTTRDSQSTYATVDVEGPWVQLKLERLGNKITKFWRPDGGTWTFLETQDRPDLEGPVDVGLCFLTNFIGESDLRADIDWVSWNNP